MALFYLEAKSKNDTSCVRKAKKFPQILGNQCKCMYLDTEPIIG